MCNHGFAIADTMGLGSAGTESGLRSGSPETLLCLHHNECFKDHVFI